MSATGLTESLSELSQEYSYRLNMLLEEGRDDLAAALAGEYERRTLELLGDSLTGSI
jgi:hypothetical protein